MEFEIRARQRDSLGGLVVNMRAGGSVCEVLCIKRDIDLLLDLFYVFCLR